MTGQAKDIVLVMFVNKGKAIPIQTWTGTGYSRRLGLRDHDSQHLKVVGLSIPTQRPIYR
jgi:hypothetical protein